MYRSLGSGQRIDTSNARPHREPSRQVKVIQAEILTDAGGAISNIHFVRSSGQPGVDAYVAESIKENWPGRPSMKSLVELTYSQAAGFSEPKVLSSSPL
jgi:hypothetical protein